MYLIVTRILKKNVPGGDVPPCLLSAAARSRLPGPVEKTLIADRVYRRGRVTRPSVSVLRLMAAPVI
jgi:hypothetical protein